jgi:hypothetical protein
MKFVTPLFNDVCALSLKDCVEPQLDLEKGDRAIGILPDELKPFWTVMCNSAKNIGVLRNEVHDKTMARLHESRRVREGLVSGAIKPEELPSEVEVSQSLAASFQTTVQHFLAHMRQKSIESAFRQELAEAFPAQAMNSDLAGEWLTVRKGWQVVSCARPNGH